MKSEIEKMLELLRKKDLELLINNIKNIEKYGDGYIITFSSHPKFPLEMCLDGFINPYQLPYELLKGIKYLNNFLSFDNKGYRCTHNLTKDEFELIKLSINQSKIDKINKIDKILNRFNLNIDELDLLLEYIKNKNK